jgi:hypothetical protein
MVTATTIVGLSGAAWGAIAAVAGPLIAFGTWLLARRHTEEIEDSDAMSRAVTAVTDANIALTTAAASILGPLQARISDLEEANKHLSDRLSLALLEHDRFRNEMTEVRGRVQVMFGYVQALRSQIVELGGQPVDFPEELDGFTFD